jgi:hypothetical protein
LRPFTPSGEWIKFGIWEKGSVTQIPAPVPPKNLKGRELGGAVGSRRGRLTAGKYQERKRMVLLR